MRLSVSQALSLLLACWQLMGEFRPGGFSDTGVSIPTRPLCSLVSKGNSAFYCLWRKLVREIGDPSLPQGLPRKPRAHRLGVLRLKLLDFLCLELATVTTQIETAKIQKERMRVRVHIATGCLLRGICKGISCFSCLRWYKTQCIQPGWAPLVVGAI